MIRKSVYKRLITSLSYWRTLQNMGEFLAHDKNCLSNFNWYSDVSILESQRTMMIQLPIFIQFKMATFSCLTFPTKDWKWWKLQENMHLNSGRIWRKRLKKWCRIRLKKCIRIKTIKMNSIFMWFKLQVCCFYFRTWY